MCMCVCLVCVCVRVCVRACVCACVCVSYVAASAVLTATTTRASATSALIQLKSCSCNTQQQQQRSYSWQSPLQCPDFMSCHISIWGSQEPRDEFLTLLANCILPPVCCLNNPLQTFITPFCSGPAAATPSSNSNAHTLDSLLKRRLDFMSWCKSIHNKRNRQWNNTQKTNTHKLTSLTSYTIPTEPDNSKSKKITRTKKVMAWKKLATKIIVRKGNKKNNPEERQKEQSRKTTKRTVPKRNRWPYVMNSSGG